MRLESSWANKALRRIAPQKVFPLSFPFAWNDERQRAIKENHMRTFTAVVERCPDTSLYVGYVPGFPGAHSQGETMDELAANLKEVLEMLLEEGEPRLEAEFVG